MTTRQNVNESLVNSKQIYNQGAINSILQPNICLHYNAMKAVLTSDQPPQEIELLQ